MNKLVSFMILELWAIFICQAAAEGIVAQPSIYTSTSKQEFLWHIARKQINGQDINIYQMLLALFRANPHAFYYSCNFNSLRKKVNLTVPTLEEVKAIPRQEAVAEFQRQGAEWQNHQQKRKILSCPKPLRSLQQAKQEPQPISSKTLPQKPETITLEWLELSQDALKFWQSQTISHHSERIRITPKWSAIEEKKRKKLLALVPKPSESYSLALSELLKVLREHDILTEITLINFNKEEKLGQAAIHLAEQENVDLIFSMGSESAAFLHGFYSKGKIPVVTCTNKDPVLLGQVADYEQKSGTNIAYTSLNVPLDVQINYLLSLKPYLKNVGIMYDRNHAQVVATEVVPMREKLLKLDIHVLDVRVSAAETAVAELATAIPQSIIEMQRTDPVLQKSLFWITSSTSVFSNIATVNQFSGHIPVIGGIPNVVGEGENSAVVAIGVDRRNNARLASLYAVKILTGQAKPGELKVGVISPPDIAISFHIARKIGLKIPFDLFESASFIYDYEGNPVRTFGQNRLARQ